MTIIRVSRQTLDSNRATGCDLPAVEVVYAVGTPAAYCASYHDVEILGPCRVVSTLPGATCCGKVWIETDAEVRPVYRPPAKSAAAAKPIQV